MTRLFATGLIVLALAGCQKEEPLPPHQGSAPTTTQAVDSGTVTPVNTGTTATTAPPVSAPAAAPASSGTPIATTDSEWSGVVLNVTELKRSSGGTLTLKFQIVNVSGTEAVGFGYNFGASYGSVDSVHLLDPVGKKKYFVVRDAENKCVCSRDLSGSVKSGERINLWAKFPAPPPDVQRVSVVVPHFLPLDDVPIS